MAWPVVVVAMPLTVKSELPAVPGVKEIAATRLELDAEVDAPVRAVGREIVMSIRPATALTEGRKVVCTPPCIIKDPCVTVGLVTTAGL